MSKIEWTEATWNPIVGCSKTSPGCEKCYAIPLAHRLGSNPASHYAGTTRRSGGKTQWTGKIALAPEKTLTAPLRRRKPTMYFVNSMGDLFHEDVEEEWINAVFAVMAVAQKHCFQVLTKRADRMQDYVRRTGRTIHWLETAARKLGYTLQFESTGLVPWPLPNVWLGVSAEDQQRADERIPLLLETPAAVRFVSAEPLLGPIDLAFLHSNPKKPGDLWNALTGAMGQDGATYYHPIPNVKLDWVIVGGESGPGARPMQPDWARSIVEQCSAAHVPVFVKQLGSVFADALAARGYRYDRKAGDIRGWPDDLRVREMPGVAA